MINMLKNIHLLLLMKMRLMNNGKVKQAVFSTFYKNYPADRLMRQGDEYSVKHLDVLVRDSAMRQLNEHIKNGDRVVIVTASLDIWLKKWCENNNAELICTQAEAVGNIMTGRFATPNCYGPEKVRRIKELINLSDYNEIYAYGDSRGDREMLALADKSFYRQFS